MVVREVPEIRPLQRAEYDKLVELGMFEDERIANMAERCIEVYRQPAGESYASVQRFEPGTTIIPLDFPELSVPVSAVI